MSDRFVVMGGVYEEYIIVSSYRVLHTRSNDSGCHSNEGRKRSNGSDGGETAGGLGAPSAKATLRSMWERKLGYQVSTG